MISKEEYEQRRSRQYGPSTEDWLYRIHQDYLEIYRIFLKAVERGDAGFAIPSGPYTNLRLALNQIENEHPGFRLDWISNDQGNIWVAIT